MAPANPLRLISLSWWQDDEGCRFWLDLYFCPSHPADAAALASELGRRIQEAFGLDEHWITRVDPQASFGLVPIENAAGIECGDCPAQVAALANTWAASRLGDFFGQPHQWEDFDQPWLRERTQAGAARLREKWELDQECSSASLGRPQRI